MTFLARKPDKRYDWPKKEDSDSDIHFKYIFAGHNQDGRDNSFSY